MLSVTYRDHRKGSGGPPGGVAPPGGPHGLRGAGSQPLVGWPHPLPWAHAPRVEGGTLEGAPPLAWGASHPLPLSPWPPPPSRWDLEGPAPFSLPPINRGVRGGQPHHPPRHSPPLPNTSPPPLCAWRSPVGVLPLHHHHAVVLPVELSSSTSPSPCWINKEETSPGCTCVERGGAVRSALGSPVIWITTSTTPSTPFS